MFFFNMIKKWFTNTESVTKAYAIPENLPVYSFYWKSAFVYEHQILGYERFITRPLTLDHFELLGDSALPVL